MNLNRDLAERRSVGVLLAHPKARECVGGRSGCQSFLRSSDERIDSLSRCFVGCLEGSELVLPLKTEGASSFRSRLPG